MKKVIWLRVYKGKRILRAENGEVENENQIVKLTHNTLEWNNYLGNLPTTPYCKVEVVKVLQPSEEVVETKVREGLKTVVRESIKINYKEVEITDALKAEVLKAHKGVKEVKLTPEQIEIAELKAKVEKLINGGGEKVKKEVKKVEVVDDDGGELETLRVAYLEKFGKKAHHMKGIKKLKAELSK